MSRYIVHWNANPSAWPTDPKQVLDLFEGVTAGADHLLASGALTDLNFVSSHEGYAIFEADSKASVLGMVQGFFPFYSQSVEEMVPWVEGKEAILADARRAAGG